MYRTIINLKKNITESQLAFAHQSAMQAFDNHVGKIENSGSDPYQLVFEGEGELCFNAIGVGYVTLHDEVAGFKELVESWPYIDTEYPQENCDILKEFAEDLH